MPVIPTLGRQTQEPLPHAIQVHETVSQRKSAESVEKEGSGGGRPHKAQPPAEGKRGQDSRTATDKLGQLSGIGLEAIEVRCPWFMTQHKDEPHLELACLLAKSEAKRSSLEKSPPLGHKSPRGQPTWLFLLPSGTYSKETLEGKNSPRVGQACDKGHQPGRNVCGFCSRVASDLLPSLFLLLVALFNP